MNSTDTYLAAADRLLTEVVPGARGTWPRACAWLIRLALENELTRFWAGACPPVTHVRSRRAQLLLLGGYATRDVSRQASHAWACLSRAGHQHSYELALTAKELRRLCDEVNTVVATLRDIMPATAAAPPHS
ncbi:hypothetical protein ACFQO7_34570 [Catellatospora aurea]|uniref:SAV-6107-like HEPN domain-containing protein n=1 Tax=Catellatospora aurea TaxID=1337874 RepID=A0ABW2H6M3_9ACTN